TYTQVVISTNGLVSFNTTGSPQYVNQPILEGNTPSNYATCFWTDQIVHATDGAWVETVGSAPNRTVVITFRLSDAGASGAQGPYRYQMILYEGSNRIKCQYMQMDGYPVGDGRGATIGIRNWLGNGGVQYFYGNRDGGTYGPIENQLAIQF